MLIKCLFVTGSEPIKYFPFFYFDVKCDTAKLYNSFLTYDYANR